MTATGATADENAELGESTAIAVVVRVRPLTPAERRSGYSSAWSHDEQRIWQTQALGSVSGRPLPAGTSYDYDRVFGPETTTGQIHGEVKHSVARTLAGYNATIFAYGQTSSGKTTTIRGGAGSEGLIPLCVRQVLAGVAAAQAQPGAARWSLKMAYLEIYNEVIGDLLSGQTNLAVYERRDGGLTVQDLRETSVGSWAEVEKLLLAGDERKHVACTQRNDESSRAHTIFRLTVTCSRGDAASADGFRETSAELNIIDLAGSERASPHSRGPTKAGGGAPQKDLAGRDMRTTEMCAINKSLLVLGTVIQKLGEAAQAQLKGGGGNGGGNGATHVPYRSSKLTRLLQRSLGGDALCTIVCCVTPAGAYGEETHNSLRFASRARTVRNVVVCQEKLDVAAQTRKLEAQVVALKKSLAASEAARLSHGASVAAHQQRQETAEETRKLAEELRAARAEAEAAALARDDAVAAKEAEAAAAREEARVASLEVEATRAQAEAVAEAARAAAAERAEHAEAEAEAEVAAARLAAERAQGAAASAAAEASAAAARAAAAEGAAAEQAAAAAQEARDDERSKQRAASDRREARLESRLQQQAQAKHGEGAPPLLPSPACARVRRRARVCLSSPCVPASPRARVCLSMHRLLPPLPHRRSRCHSHSPSLRTHTRPSSRRRSAPHPRPHTLGAVVSCVRQRRSR